MPLNDLKSAIIRIICVYVCLLCQDTKINEFLFFACIFGAHRLNLSFLVCALFVWKCDNTIKLWDEYHLSAPFVLTKYICCFYFRCCCFYCTCDKLINAYSLAHYVIYSSRHFFFINCTRATPSCN